MPHWSRWEKSATTFGPVGRILLTLGFVLSIPPSWSFGMILYLVWAPVFGYVFLSSVWAKGWVVPDEPDLPPLPDRPAPEVVPDRMTPVQIAFRITAGVTALAMLLAILGGPAEVRSAVMMTAGFALLYGVFRWSFSR